MAEMSMVVVRQRFSYDPLTGQLTWREVKRNRAAKRWIGKPAGSKNQHGYVQVQVDGRMYQAHRLIWLYVYGEIPEYIDHVNGAREDNRLANLRACRAFENQQNRKRHENTTTGYTGVIVDKRRGKFVAKIGFLGKQKHLGSFNTPQEAHAAYLAAKRSIHTFNPTVRLPAPIGEEG